ncbi:MAG: transcription termination/antitermination protein NusA [Dehalococcoidia bacterium]|nr:transcription termination/antitermination protein NusA [Dehalococcoidia bacterium]
MKNEFDTAIKFLASEKNLDTEVVYRAIEDALASAYRKDELADRQLRVQIDRLSGDIHVWIVRNIVHEVEDEKIEITLDEARETRPDAMVGETIEYPVEPHNTGRIAAQTAKQVVLQRLRESERDVVYKEYSEKSSDIVSGVVQRVEPRQVIVDLGKTEAVLPLLEQVRTEHYRPGQRLKVYVVDVDKAPKGPQVTVSRTHKNLIRRLFELEVPEIFKGAVELKAIAREPGYRSKVAVVARQEGIDPVGACVGLRGIRIQNIVNELNGERIDVVEWDSEPARFVANALSPAHVSQVRIHEDEKTAEVVVPDRMLSLAIGKQGQNARLAAKLTGWRIDIKSESVAGKLPPLPARETPILAPAPEVAGVTDTERPAPPDREFVDREDLVAEVAVEEAAPEAPAAAEPVAADGRTKVRFAEEILSPRTEEPPRKKAKGKKPSGRVDDDDDAARARKPKKGGGGARRIVVEEDDAEYDFATALDQYDTDFEAEYKEDD